MLSLLTITDEESARQSTAVRGRGCLFYVRRGLLALVVLIVAVPILGMIYQAAAEASDRQTYRPSGQMVDVEGHQMHIYCTGKGSPTVILEAGAFSFSMEWYWVQQQLEQTNRACSYDRAGNGWSEPGPAPRDGIAIVRELRALLEKADVPGPYVLVGHSLGGVLNRIYASQYPEDVIGIVQVDSAVPLTWPDESGYEQWKSQNQSAYTLMAALVRVGAARIIISREFQGYGYPPAIAAELTAFKATAQGVDTWDAEFRLAQWDLSQQAATAENLSAQPVVVMWASHPEITAAEDRAILQAIWDMVPAFSSNSVVRIVEGADHGSIVGSEQYARQVSEAVRDVIQSADSGEPLAQ